MIFLIPFFAFVDRLLGSDVNRAKSIGNTSVFILSLWMAFVNPIISFFMATWLIYRNIPWSIGGTTTPRSNKQIIGSLLRHGVFIVPTTVDILMGWLPLYSITFPILYSIIVTLGLIQYSKHIDDRIKKGLPENPKFNASIEILRGALFGLMLVLIV